MLLFTNMTQDRIDGASSVVDEMVRVIALINTDPDDRFTVYNNKWAFLGEKNLLVAIETLRGELTKVNPNVEAEVGGIRGAVAQIRRDLEVLAEAIERVDRLRGVNAQLTTQISAIENFVSAY